MINITDISLLKITRVRPWSICFDYDNKHYLIHGSSEMGEGSWQELYKRDLDVNGKYKLTHLKNCAVFLLVIFDNSLHILDSSSLLDICIAKIFLLACALCFHFPNIVF